MWLILHSQPVHIFCVAYHYPAIAKTVLYENHFIETVEITTCFYSQAHFTICGDFNDFDMSKVVEQLPMTHVSKGLTYKDSQLEFGMSTAEVHYKRGISFAPSLPFAHVALVNEPLQTTRNSHRCVFGRKQAVAQKLGLNYLLDTSEFSWMLEIKDTNQATGNL